MAYTRKQIVTCLSIVYLIFATALAAFASSRVNNLAIPIPSLLSGFTTLLPFAAGLLLEIGYDLNRRQERRQRLPRGSTPRPPLVLVANTIIFIYSTVVITLLGTHTAPQSGLNCGLEARWTSMFSRKDEEAIRAIQNAFNCCGLMNSHDRAWPFPDRSHDARACENAFSRTQGCIGPWRGEERHMAGILMAVVGLVSVWQVAIIIFPMRPTPIHNVLPTRISRFLTDENQEGSRRAIDYLPNFQRYSDRITGEASDSEEDDPPLRSEGGVQQVREALPNMGHDEEQSRAANENEWTRN